MNAAYLAAAADGIYERLYRHREPNSKDLQEGTWLACRALQTLADDEEFRQAIQQAADVRAQHRPQYDVITGAATDSLEHFEHFLTMEHRLMRVAGMQDDLVRELLAQIRTLIRPLRQWHQASSAAEIVSSVFESVRDLRDRTCMLAEENHDRAKLIGGLKAVMPGLGGVAVISINHLALGILTLDGMSVSIAAGAILADVARDALSA